MSAISASNRLCQGMRLLMPANKSISSATSSRQISAISTAFPRNNNNDNNGCKIDHNNGSRSHHSSKSHSGINSLVHQISSLRLASTSASDFFPSSSSSSSSPFASFHSSTASDGPKKKPPAPEVVRPVEELPAKPKRPLSSYFEFCAINRPLVRRAQPDLKPTETVKVLAEMWKRLNPSEKEKYVVQSRRRQQEYEKAMEEWDKSITETEKANLINAEKAKKEAKEKGELKAKQKREQKALEAELGKPKRPLSTYFLFLQEQRRLRDKMGGSGDHKSWLKSCGEKYRLLPTTELERLLKTYNAQKKSYDVALEAWHKRMNRDGRSTFVGSRQ